MNTTMTTKTNAAGCTSHTVVAADFGIKDEKGRAYGGSFTVYEPWNAERTTYSVCTQALRNGEHFGASCGKRYTEYPTLEAAMKGGHAKLAAMAKKYAKRAAK